MTTSQEFRQSLSARGESVSAWSQRHGLQAQVVFDLLRGRSKGLRGEAHRAAVLLGMKHGDITGAASATSAAKTKKKQRGASAGAGRDTPNNAITPRTAQ